MTDNLHSGFHVDIKKEQIDLSLFIYTNWDKPQRKKPKKTVPFQLQLLEPTEKDSMVNSIGSHWEI